MSKIYLYILFAAVVLGYFSWSQWHIGGLNKDKAKLEISVESQKLAINNLKAQAIAQAETFAKIQDVDDTEKLQSVLRKHSLERLAVAKPKLVKKAIQNATNKLFDNITAITSPDGVQ